MSMKTVRLGGFVDENIQNINDNFSEVALNKADVSSIPTKTSQLTNDSGFATGVDIENKVDKESGKGLSSNDYTSQEKEKLAGIEESANYYSHPLSHPASIIVETNEKKFVSQSEKDTWGDKYTKSEVDNKFSMLETNIDWKESVNTFEDIAVTYPNPQDGWTVNVKDTDYTWRYNGTQWVVISANAVPKATAQVDGLMSKEDKSELGELTAKKHVHENTSVLDTITSVLVEGWNSAVTHISDAVKHITAEERTLWNGVENKVDKDGEKGLSSNDYTTAEKNKLAAVAPGAVKVEASVNGKIKINDVDTTVYELPVAADTLGGVKNGGNVTVNADGTMTAPAAEQGASVARIDFTADDANWGALVGNVYTLTLASGGKSPMGIYRKDGSVYCTVMADVQIDGSNIKITSYDKFEGYLLTI